MKRAISQPELPPGNTDAERDDMQRSIRESKKNKYNGKHGANND